MLWDKKITVYHVIPSEKLSVFQWSRTFHADTGDSFQNIVSLQNSFPISRYSRVSLCAINVIVLLLYKNKWRWKIKETSSQLDSSIQEQLLQMIDLYSYRLFNWPLRCSHMERWNSVIHILLVQVKLATIFFTFYNLPTDRVVTRAFFFCPACLVLLFI